MERTMARQNDDRSAYRCTVAPENSRAQLVVGRKKYDVSIQETSRDGFGVRMSNTLASKLSDMKVYELLYAGEDWLVTKEGHYTDDDVTVVGFKRQKEVTKIKSPVSWFPFLSSSRSQSDPAFLLYLMIAFLVACVALPGMGDSLGTAPRIKKGFQTIFEVVNDIIW